jgi:hypothetical protein
MLWMLVIASGTHDAISAYMALSGDVAKLPRLLVNEVHGREGN